MLAPYKSIVIPIPRSRYRRQRPLSTIGKNRADLRWRIRILLEVKMDRTITPLGRAGRRSGQVQSNPRSQGRGSEKAQFVAWEGIAGVLPVCRTLKVSMKGVVAAAFQGLEVSGLLLLQHLDPYIVLSMPLNYSQLKVLQIPGLQLGDWHSHIQWFESCSAQHYGVKKRVLGIMVNVSSAFNFTVLSQDG